MNNKSRRPTGGKMVFPIGIMKFLMLIVMVMGLAVPALAQVIPLAPIPKEGIDIGAKVRLQADKSRLQIYRNSLQRIGDIFNAECGAVEVGTDLFERCTARYRELDGFRQEYSAEAKAFNEAVARASLDNTKPSNLEGPPAHSAGSGAIRRITVRQGALTRSSGRPLHARLLPGEEISTSPDASVELYFSDGSTIILGGNTVFRVPHNIDHNTSEAELLWGKILAVIECTKRQGKCLRRMRTPAAIAGVRGTIYELFVDRDRSLSLVVLEGTVELENRRDGTMTTVVAGQELTMTANGTSVNVSDLNLMDYKRWW